MRPADGAQRGSVMDMPVYPGDPLTPGVGATADAKRLAVKDATTLTKIPVMPISYARRAAAARLADRHGRPGRVARRSADHVSLRPWSRPRAPQARLQLGPEAALRRHCPPPRIDVSGSVGDPRQPSRRVGQRRRGSRERHGGDARRGARARRAAQAGWSPKRTIVYCAWDGEEPALLGSTEWAETHAAELQQHAVAYLNSDSNGRGFLDAEGSHALEHFINDVARDIEDPETHLTVLEAQAGARNRAGKGRGQGEGSQPPGFPHRRARIRIRLHAVSAASRDSVAEHRLRRRGQQRDLPLDLRRLLLLHALPRHRLRLRAGAGADRRDGDDSTRRRRHPAVPALEPRRHGAHLRRGTAATGEEEAGRDCRAQSRDRGRRVRGDQRSAPAAGCAEGRAAAAADRVHADLARDRDAGPPRRARWTRRAPPR